jgi:hypothetical protein
MDTLYFATGTIVNKEKGKDEVILSAGQFTVNIKTNRNIVVNKQKCKSISEAKWAIQKAIA